MLKNILVKNINLRNYFIYALSTTLYVIVIFVLLSLLNVNEILNLGAREENSKLIFMLYYILLSLIGAFFMIYALKCYIKTRILDYSMLRIFGATKKQLFIILVLELFFVLFLGITLGLFSGNLIIQGLSHIFSINGVEVNIPVVDLLKNAIGTICASTILFGSSVLYGAFNCFKKNISKMMLAGTKREYKYKYLNCLAFFGMAIMIMSVLSLNDADFLHNLLCMLICVMGTYIFISYGISLLLSILKMIFNKVYLKNIICINDFYFRYKTTKKLIFITFLINFIVIFLVGGIIVTTTNGENYDTMYPFENILVNENSNNEEILDKIIGNQGIKVKGIRCHAEVEETVEDSIIAITCNDYNKITNGNLYLKDETILFYQDLDKGQYANITTLNMGISNAENNIKVKRIVPKVLFGVGVPDNASYIAVVPNEYVENSEISIYLEFNSSLINKLKRINDTQIIIRSEIVKQCENDSLILKISSYFLGIFSVICSLGILALKEQSDVKNKICKYNTLKYLGMSKNDRKVNLSRELKIFISIPIILSNILVWFFIKAELVRVDLLERRYILSFIYFQVVLLLIQYIFYRIIRKYLLQEINVA